MRCRIAAIAPAGAAATGAGPASSLDGGIALPRLVDVHVHLDKGHIWPRSPNPDGTFPGALATVGADREANWSAGDVRARMDFALRGAFAHGTAAMRTHLDSLGKQIGISWPVYAELQAEWAGRIALQASPLFGADAALDPAHMQAVIAAVKPGMTLSKTAPNSLYKVALDYFNTHGKDRSGAPLGKYFTHGISHHVGLEVHDAGDPAAPIEPGAVITVEPGLYIPDEGIGIRIEDMVLVTSTGGEVLTGALPNARNQIEDAVRK